VLEADLCDGAKKKNIETIRYVHNVLTDVLLILCRINYVCCSVWGRVISGHFIMQRNFAQPLAKGEYSSDHIKYNRQFTS
jgi:hypothetical protein